MLTYFCQVVGGGSVRRREGAKFCYTCVNARPPVWVLGDPGGMGVECCDDFKSSCWSRQNQSTRKCRDLLMLWPQKWNSVCVSCVTHRPVCLYALSSSWSCFVISYVSLLIYLPLIIVHPILTTPSLLGMIITLIFGVTIEHTNLMTKIIQFSS